MDTIIKTLFEITIYSSVMIVGVLAMKAIWSGRISLKIVKLLWLLVLVRLLLPVTFDSPLRIQNFLPEQTSKSVQDLRSNQTDNQGISIEPKVLDNENNLNYPSTYYDNPGSLEDAIAIEKPEIIQETFLHKILGFFTDMNIIIYIFILWMCGVIIYISRFVFEYIKFNKLVKKSVVVKTGDLLSTISECKKRINIDKDITVKISRYVRTPITFKIKKPVIILPVNFVDNITGNKLRMILMHELCHIKRHDIFINTLWLMAKTIHWFNPLVWIAYRYYLEDIELSCDEFVLKTIGSDERYSYSQSLIEVIKLSKRKAKIPTTAAFCEDKTKIRKRVENMIQPKKKLKTAGIISIIMAIILIVGCFTTACRPELDTTVENDNIRKVSLDAENSETQKEDEDDYSEKMDEENSMKNEAEESFARYNAPETFVKTYESGGLKIIMDAKLNVPAYDMQSVVLSPLELTQDFADAFISFFSQDTALYKKINADQSYDFYLNRLAVWKKCLYNAQNNWDEVKGHDPYGNDRDRAIVEIEGMIEWVEQQLEIAPKDVKYEAITSQLVHPVEEGKDVPGGEPEKITDTSRLVLDAYTEVEDSNTGNHMAHYYLSSNGGTAETLSYDNSNDASSNGMILRSAEINELAKMIALTVEQADSYARNSLKSMGINYMDLADYSYSAAIKDGELYPYYKLRYTRSVSGVPIKPVSEAYILSDKKDSGICTQIETIYVDVDESGVIGFNWNNVMKQDELLDDSLDIMGFDRIIEIAESQLQNQSYKKDGDLEIVISEISLSLMPVETGNENEIKTIPVWDFIGYHYSNGDLEEKQKMIELNVEFSYLTINAVDGSLINR